LRRKFFCRLPELLLLHHWPFTRALMSSATSSSSTSVLNLYRSIWLYARGARVQLVGSAALLIGSQLIKLSIPWLTAQANVASVEGQRLRLETVEGARERRLVDRRPYCLRRLRIVWRLDDKGGWPIVRNRLIGLLEQYENSFVRHLGR